MLIKYVKIIIVWSFLKLQTCVATIKRAKASFWNFSNKTAMCIKHRLKR